MNIICKLKFQSLVLPYPQKRHGNKEAWGHGPATQRELGPQHTPTHLTVCGSGQRPSKHTIISVIIYFVYLLHPVYDCLC
jgi:hypothetical protein